ncbi:hypothetical protein UFOVP1138_32 [uncultured Caudovirales phage]|uniref:Uncharacterized protein n=1 Tax=uncultured Caudovirales phage TaxID=2100421 RepID=A0A6J5PSC0_9CAUD|nr:hypothetical protein UFOVP975_89 [uncultured Caudovirales phage]CAB4186233.1 hypothetical protein UFOVP1138_32 [uncultured Caudovirales phage]CAB4204409.1 hypothetical protein UFOVP1394_29 [uncultured Caudovirales phage]
MSYAYDSANLVVLKETAIDAMESTINSCRVYYGEMPAKEYIPAVIDSSLLDMPKFADAQVIVNRFLTKYTPTPPPTAIVWPTLPKYPDITEFDISSITSPFEDTTVPGSVISLWKESSLFSDIQATISKSLAKTKISLTSIWDSADKQATERRNQTITSILTLNRSVARGFKVPDSLTDVIPMQVSHYAELDALSQANEVEILMSEHANIFVQFAMKLGVSNEDMLMQFTKAYNQVLIEIDRLAVEVYKEQIEAIVSVFDLMVKQEMSKLEYRKEQIRVISARNMHSITVMEADIEQKKIQNYPIELTLKALSGVIAEYNANAVALEMNIYELEQAAQLALTKAKVDIESTLTYMKSTITGYSEGAKSAATSIKSISSASEINLTA